jgi:hypothetical protein
MIGGTRCVGCYNREREAASGKNARGNVPVKVLADRVLRTIDLTVIVDGVAQRVQARNVVDSFEPMMQVMRTTRGRVGFAFTGSWRALRQPPLFIGATHGRVAPVRASSSLRRPPVPEPHQLLLFAA